jgi:hypothetical protein
MTASLSVHLFVLCALQQAFWASLAPEVAGPLIPTCRHCEIAAHPARVNLLKKIRIVGLTQSQGRLSVSDIGGALVEESSGGHISHIPNSASPLDNSTAVEAGDACGWEGGVTAVGVAADGTVGGKGASGAAGMLRDVSPGISTLAATGVVSGFGAERSTGMLDAAAGGGAAGTGMGVAATIAGLRSRMISFAMLASYENGGPFASLGSQGI